MRKKFSVCFNAPLPFSVFPDEVRHEGGKVLIHCQAGVSRSATITIAYIMSRSRLAMHDTFRFVKSRRAIVSPNFNFMGQLYSLEQALESGEQKRDVVLDLTPPPAPNTLQVPPSM